MSTDWWMSAEAANAPLTHLTPAPQMKNVLIDPDLIK
jgi:hypothetical protein